MGAAGRFAAESDARVDANSAFALASMAVMRWSACYLDLLGSLVVFAAALFAVYTGRAGLPASLVGLSVSYAFQLTSSLNWSMKMFTELETNVVSLERIAEYAEVCATFEFIHIK